MTSSAPMERTSASLLVLATPVTWAPNALASWTAYDPTPPAAPITRTRWPGWTPQVAERLKGGEAGDGDDRRLLEGEAGRLRLEMVLTGTGVLGVGAVAPAEHLVARLEPGDVAADCLDL